MMFNRRRAGEIERLLLTDYANRTSVDEHVNPDLYATLSEQSRAFANKYVHLTIRGKLGRTVPVMLDPTLVEWIETILKYRSHAKVKSSNEFVFGLPTRDKFKKPYLRACSLMRKFSEECGASIPESLRGTTLRKHIATYTAMLNIEENQVGDLAKFMGHNPQIHKDVYRLSSSIKNVTDVSRLLRSAMGMDDNETDNESVDEIEPMPSTSGIVMPQQKDLHQRDIDDLPSSSEDDLDNTGSSGRSKRRSTSPYGKTRRRRWTEDEKRAVESFFGDPSKIIKLPTLQKCQEAIQKNSAFSGWKPQELKTWIDNQRKSVKRKANSSR
ncbi:uncharacterized protein [Venturia canescens]|uniref:uncharacterized protein n=1 Tax=Venturia canescens TaxID=32260 RepID=UPI001C9C2AA9|nr:uncharacterized protein LOC122410582 [Venturia canescens]XP_043274753.1 uncharacterized protein LOC122410582 [Venturia canescens]